MKYILKIQTDKEFIDIKINGEDSVNIENVDYITSDKHNEEETIEYLKSEGLIDKNITGSLCIYSNSTDGKYKDIIYDSELMRKASKGLIDIRNKGGNKSNYRVDSSLVDSLGEFLVNTTSKINMYDYMTNIDSKIPYKIKEDLKYVHVSENSFSSKVDVDQNSDISNDISYKLGDYNTLRDCVVWKKKHDKRFGLVTETEIEKEKESVKEDEFLIDDNKNDSNNSSGNNDLDSMFDDGQLTLPGIYVSTSNGRSERMADIAMGEEYDREYSMKKRK